jgi:MFS family permease
VPANPRRRRWLAAVAGLRIDVTPLRTSRDFRLLFSAGTVFYLGGMVTYVALPFQLYRLTGSNFAVGLMGVVELVPLLLFGLYGGALADHVDRQRMLVVTGTAQVVLTALLLGNSLLDRPQIWLIYVVGALLSIAQALQRPSREALIPRTVRHGELPAAVALNSFGTQVGMLAGPTIGGLLIATAGVPWAYGVDVLGLIIATILFSRMRSYPPGADSTPPSVAGIVDGVRYALRRRDLLGTYVVDMVAMFMAMPVVLFPPLPPRSSSGPSCWACSTPPRPSAR